MPRIVTPDDVMLETPDVFAANPSLPLRLLNSGLNINVLRPVRTEKNKLRTNALLHKDEWEELDRRVVEISANVLNGVADLRAMGLVQPLGGLGVLVSQYEQVSDMTSANVNMAAQADDEEDRVEFPLIGVPVPIISKGFRIDIRSLSGSRAAGSGLDTTHVDTATRKVAEMQEQMLFQGYPLVQRGGTIYGYSNHPSVNVVTGGADWGTATNILPNVLAMVSALVNDNFYGPYRLYLHPDQYMQTFALNAATAVPIIRTLEQIPGLGPGAIRPTNYLPAGTGVLVNMSRDVVDLAIGQETAPVQWDEKGGLMSHWKVLCALVPRVKVDASGRSGVAKMAGI